MKKIVIALLAVLLVASCIVGIVACNDNKTERENVLDNYIFESNGQVVSEDFVLPGTIGDRTVTWSSDNTAVVAVALSNVDGNWTATITPPEGNTATVTLTVTEGEFTRTFTVQVKPIDVYDIIGGYKFSKERATVTADFDLDSTATYKGKSANIAWSVDEAYKAYISVDTTGDHGPVCKVNPQAEVTAVQIKATFTYGSETATKTYRMNVYREMKGLELVDYWYNNTGVSIEMSGWVVEVGTAYSSTYKNITFYMVNDDGTAGYYLYRTEAKDDATGEAIKPGVHVTVTGTTNQNYNGLIETNKGGTVVVDSDKTPIDIRTMIKAIDDEVIGEVPALIYNESRLVSLTNWKVKSVSTKVDTTQLTTQTILTIEKEGVKVAVVVSKYVEGAYADKDNAEYKALCGLASTYKEGDYVSVTGIWSNYNGWQIIPLKASDVVKAQADAEGTTYAGTSVKSAVNAVAKALSEGGLDKRVTKESKANLPTSVDGVTIKYALISSNAITLTEGEKAVEAKVVPGNTETGVIQVTYTIGEFSTVEFLHITSLIPTAQTMMSDLEEIMPTSIKAVTDLPTLEGVEIKWEITDAGKVVIDGKEVADAKAIEIANGQLVPTLSENAVKVKVKASLTYKEEDAYTVFTITVEAGKGAKAIDMAEVKENTPYILTIDQTNLSKQLYAQSELSGYYGATTDNFDEASKVYVEFVKDAEEKVTGYKLYFNKDGKYIGVVQSGTYTNYKVDLTSETASVFTYDETNKCLKTTVGDTEYYIGTYGTYNTVSASKIEKISGSFPAYLGVETFQQLAENDITVKATNATVENLSTNKGKNGAKFTFTVSVDEGYNLASVMVGSTEVEPDTKGVYTGRIDGPTTITVSALSATPSTITIKEFLEKAEGDDVYTIEGWIVAGASGNSFVVADSTGAVFSYNKENTAKIGDKVKVYGTRSSNYGVPQIGTTKVEITETTETYNPTVTELKASEIDLSKLSKDTIGDMCGTYYKITGVYLVKSSSGYIDGYLDSEGKSQVLSTYFVSGMVSDDMLGKEAIVYGYVRGCSTGKYLTIQVAKVELAQEGDTPVTPVDPVDPVDPTPGTDATYPQVAIDMAKIAENVPYILTINQKGLEKQLYALNDMNGYYGATTEDISSAAKIYVKLVKDGETVTGYKLYYTDSSYITIVKSGTHINYTINNAEDKASVFTWDATNNCLKTTVEGTEYYMGTFGTYNTVSASSIDKVSTSYAAFLSAAPEGGETGTETPGGGETETPDTPVESGNTVTVTINSYGTANNWNMSAGQDQKDQYKEVKFGNVAKLTLSATDQNTGKWYSNGWRTYQKGNCTYTFTAESGYSLVSVKITYSVKNTGTLLNGTTVVASNDVVTVNANSITLSIGNTGAVDNGQVIITAIEVVYAVAE